MIMGMIYLFHFMKRNNTNIYMTNKLIDKIETSIYNNINHQSRYVSNKNSLFENLFNKLSKRFFETQDEFELFVNNYISSLSYELSWVNIDNIYCDIIKYILTTYVLVPEFSEDVLLSKLNIKDINELYSISLNIDDNDYYHGSHSAEYKLQIIKLSPELIALLADLYNIKNHTDFNIDNNGTLKSNNMDIYKYLLNDNPEDNKVKFDFTDFLTTIKTSVNVFNLSLGKLISIVS